MEEYSEEYLRHVAAEYEAARKAALAERDSRLREFASHGWRSADLQRVTGYSRETIRRALRPDVRGAGNDSRRRAEARASAHPPADYVSYAERRPYVVAESLAELHGPTRGTVSLPHHLDWSGNPVYELDRPGMLAAMYRTVLHEASSAADLDAWLDGTMLVRLWASLWLPARLRSMWEGRFPELAAVAAGERQCIERRAPIMSKHKARLTVEVEPGMAAFAEQQVQSGRAASVSEVVNRALENERHREQRSRQLWQEALDRADPAKVARMKAHVDAQIARLPTVYRDPR